MDYISKHEKRRKKQKFFKDLSDCESWEDFIPDKTRNEMKRDMEKELSIPQTHNIILD